MPARVRASLASRPGKVPDCGWRVTDAGASVPLTGRADNDTWWMRIGYLATAPSTVTVEAGESTFEVSLRSGLHDLFLRVGSGFDAVSMTGVEPGVTVCIDTIQVGPVAPEGPA